MEEEDLTLIALDHFVELESTPDRDMLEPDPVMPSEAQETAEKIPIVAQTHRTFFFGSQ